MKHIESSVKIYFTREYGAFGFLKGNRELNELKIKKIKQDIQDGFDVLKFAPIIVNEELKIIDGQHRYVVAKQLGLNVYYVITRDIDLVGVTKINSRSSNWKMIDFLNSFMDLKKENYIMLYNFLQDHPRVSLPVAMRIMHDGDPLSKTAQSEFKDGNLGSKFYGKLQRLTNLLKGFEPYMDNPYSRLMFKVIDSIIDNGKYDHVMMLRKLEESGRRIENTSSAKAIINDMESIINHRMRDRVLIH